MCKVKMTKDEWLAMGGEIFGPDTMQWKFVCPACGHVASVQDYKDAGATSDVVGFSCIGRFLPNPKSAFGAPANFLEPGSDNGPCDYTGGGLIRLNPWEVDGMQVFEFAENPEKEGRVDG